MIEGIVLKSRAFIPNATEQPHKECELRRKREGRLAHRLVSQEHIAPTGRNTMPGLSGRSKEAILIRMFRSSTRRIEHDRFLSQGDAGLQPRFALLDDRSPC